MRRGVYPAVRIVTAYKFRATTKRFLEELRLEGVRVVHDNGRGGLRVAVPRGWETTRPFFALADNHGVVLRGLQRDDEDLEELFHRVLGESVPGEDGRRMSENPSRDRRARTAPLPAVARRAGFAPYERVARSRARRWA